MPAVVVLAFLLIPLAEIYAIIQVGQTIGAGWTILLLIADSILGAWLIKREGRRAWVALQQSLGAGRMPGKELADGALVLVGGTLLLTPGFLTDALGFFLLLPFSRPFARRLVIAFAQRRIDKAVAQQAGAFPPGFPSGFASGGPQPPPGTTRGGRIVPGEVADDEGPGR